MAEYFTVTISGKFDGTFTQIEEDVISLDPWSAIKKAMGEASKKYKQIDIHMAKASCRRGYKWK